jgi:two-component system, NarL family, nitrate/nitrite response regulator NarL
MSSPAPSRIVVRRPRLAACRHLVSTLEDRHVSLRIDHNAEDGVESARGLWGFVASGTTQVSGQILLAVVGAVRVRREAIGRQLQDTAGFRVVTSRWPDPADARPDMVLLDLPRPDCFKVARAAQRGWPSISIVAIGLDDSEATAQECLRAGICSYMGLEDDLETLVGIISGVSSGERPCMPRIAAILIRQANIKQFGYSGLTPREIEIVRCLRDGYTNKEIARRLGIRIGTVKNHVHNVLAKLQVPSRANAAMLDLVSEHDLDSDRA